MKIDMNRFRKNEKLSTHKNTEYSNTRLTSYHLVIRYHISPEDKQEASCLNLMNYKNEVQQNRLIIMIEILFFKTNIKIL